MSRTHAAITVHRSRDEVERRWHAAEHADPISRGDAAVTFRDAPGDRGTEIHIELQRAPRGGVLGEAIGKLRGTDPVASVKDDLRRFKQIVETGVIARSEGAPTGERVDRKLRRRPAQPLAAEEREKAGVA